MGHRQSKWEHKRAKWEARRVRWEARHAARLQRREEKAARRKAARPEPATGVVYAIAALVCLGLALRSDMWWMVFVALGLGTSAARAFSAPREGGPSLPEGDAAPVPATPERTAAPVPAPGPTSEVDALCDAILAELREGPAVLREVLQRPEATVASLRQSFHALARREAELRRLNPPEEVERLERERQQLEARVALERDAVTRERLEGALTALDAQRRQREELRTAAARLAAEQTRLLYVLQNLRAQVLRVRSASLASAEEADGLLRRSVEQLQAEMDAVAEALEAVGGEAEPPAPVEPLGEAGTERGARGRVRG